MLTRFVLAVTAGFAALSPAAAHHPLGGKTPDGWVEGLLSGLGHPMLGVDHLAFIILIGLVASYLRGGNQVAFAFAGALVAGVGLHLLSPNLPMVEVLVAGSTLVAGAALALRPNGSARHWTLCLTLAGLIHGYALGEPIAAAPVSATILYLVGLALTSVAVIMTARWFADRGVMGGRAEGLKVRAAGGAFAALGVLFVVTAFAGA